MMLRDIIKSTMAERLLTGYNTLGKLTSVTAKVIEKGKELLPDNEPVHPKTAKIISKGNVIRDGEF
ncbi:MAG TPA: hypothetical protein EYP51_03335 [Thiotrichales bacterium]|nr:hypothetical protein [Thiotrichales bacterium]